MSLQNSNDTIGNRTRDLTVCSVVLYVYISYIFLHIYVTNKIYMFYIYMLLIYKIHIYIIYM